MESARTHCPQLARCAMEHRIVHRKRQPRLAVPAAHGHDRARAQTVVEVSRVHLCALKRRACAQLRQCIARTAPCLHERAVARPILQTNRIETVVQRSNKDCVG